jgi:hypothetical protein
MLTAQAICQIAASLTLQPPARLDPVEIAVDVELEHRRRMIRGPAGRCRIDAIEPEVAELQRIDEHIDRAKRISGGNRRLQDEEVASASSTSQSCGSSIRGSSILSALQLLGLSIAAPSGQTISTVSYYVYRAVNPGKW